MILAIIQARLHSTRLPGKVLLPLPTGRSVLQQVVQACNESVMVDNVMVVTKDEIVAENARGWCVPLIGLKSEGRNVWREYADAIDFCLQSEEPNGPTHILRITADCPLLDKGIIDKAVLEYLSSGAEYAYNHHDDEEGAGDGFDVEIFSVAGFRKARPHKEHVTFYFRDDLKTHKLQTPEREGRSLNTIEDYEYIYRSLQCQFTATDSEAVGTKPST